MQNENAHIRKLAKANGVPLWRIAHEIGVSEPTLTRWLRFTLPEEKECQILAVIGELSEGDCT